MPSLIPHDAETKLLADMDSLAGLACALCGRSVCPHEALFDIALGFKEEAHCLTCLAQTLTWEPRELRDHLLRHFDHRECYGKAWQVASAREGFGSLRQPPCLWPEGADALTPLPEAAPLEDEEINVGSSWDAGDMACGELVLALRGRMNRLAPGAVLKVTARDPAAPEDLPAWCRLTGHRLLRAVPPDYFLERKES